MKRKSSMVLVFALMGCSAQTRFIPRGQELTGTAHLIAESDVPGFQYKSGAHYMLFRSVDGRLAGTLWNNGPSNELYLMPGAHTFEVTYLHGGVYSTGRFAIDAEAGKTYYVHHQVKAYSVRMWVTEGKHGTVEVAAPLPEN